MLIVFVRSDIVDFVYILSFMGFISFMFVNSQNHDKRKIYVYLVYVIN